MANVAPYSISKAAVNLAHAKYAAEYKKEGIIFVALSPGLVNTAEAPRKWFKMNSIEYKDKLIWISMTATPEQLEGYKQMITSFQKVKRSFAGAITPEHSVNLLLEIIDKSTIADTGAILSHNGNSYDWL